MLWEVNFSFEMAEIAFTIVCNRHLHDIGLKTYVEFSESKRKIVIGVCILSESSETKNRLDFVLFIQMLK